MKYVIAFCLAIACSGSSSAVLQPTMFSQGPRSAVRLISEHHFPGTDQVLYSQPADLNGLVGSSEFIDQFGLETEIGNDFVLAGQTNTPVTVTRIRWWGGVYNYTSGDPFPTTFVLTVYGDAGCVPASQVAQILVPNDAHATDLGPGVNGLPVFEYYTDVSVELLAGRMYWLSVQAGDHPFPPQWGRLQAATLIACDSVFRSAYFGYPSWTPVIDIFGVAFDASQEIEGQIGATGGAITGKVFEDSDADCAQGQGESDLSNRKVFLVGQSMVQTTAGDGSYGFPGVPPGNYTVRLLPRPNWEQTCPTNDADQSATVTANQVTSGVDFGSRRIPGYQDLSVTVGAARARPGFQTYYEIGYRNVGNTTLSATVTLTLPPASQLTYDLSNPAGSFSNQVVTWNVGPLAPDDTGSLYVFGTLDPGVPLGTLLTTTTQIQPVAGDSHPLDNDASTSQVVSGAWDPNDKAVTPAGGIEADALLHYHVNFQNVGTAEATNIVVRDTLDLNLDISSVAFGATSHANTAQINGRALIWTFTNINLPDSTSDLAGSQGFVEFTANPVAGLPIGTELRNSASIYFDFNPAVVTNEVVSTIAPPSNLVAAGAQSTCLSTTHPCVEVPVIFHRTDNRGLRLAHVDFQLSSQLELCDPGDLDASILTAPESGDWLFDGFTNTFRHSTDNGGGSYTVDQGLLGSPCGITATGDEVLFKIRVKASAGANAVDTGTITVTAVTIRGCLNEPLSGAPGPVGNVTIDRVAAAATNLAAARVTSGNDTDGTTKITVSFTPPGTTDYQSTDIYRQRFGNYPEYDDGPGSGSVPSIPATPAAAVAAGWVLVGSFAGGPLMDEPATRDYYYYVGFSTDMCGNVSPPSNLTGGTLNYHLGDVAPGPGNNSVTGLDISLLGSDYGKTSGFNPVIDVGPTTDYSVNGRPTTDNRIDFEDLIMFAINYGAAAFTAQGPGEAGDAGRPPHGTPPALQLMWEPSMEGSTQGGASRAATATLVLRGNEDMVKGVHARIDYDPAKFVLIEVTPGALAAQGDVFFKSLQNPAAAVIDVAKLGQETTIHGDGEIAVLRFRVLGAAPRPRLAETSLRGPHNEFLDIVDPTTALSRDPAIGPTGLAATEIVGAQPNPFRSRTEIRFNLAVETPVSLRVYDPSGRLVRTLIDGVLAPGEYSAGWDGLRDDGRRVGPGVYLYALHADGKESSRKLILLQ